MKLEGDAADGTALDAFHEVGGEPGYFVAEAFGWDDCLFGMGEGVSELDGGEAKQRRTTSSMIRLLVWKSSVRRG